MTNEELLRAIEEATINKKPYLDLSNCNLKSLPPEIGKMRDLKSLNISDNRLSNLPPEIGQLTNLTRLIISKNQLSNLPPEIGQLTNLTTLAISINQLRSLPPEIGQLTNLLVLSIFENKLRSLPPEIGELTNIFNLYIGQNKLRSLPPEIGKLTNIFKLYIEENKLRRLPPEIGKLTNLKYLIISENQLTDLPPEIAQLRNLRELNISGNKLKSLPPEIVQLKNLTQIEKFSKHKKIDLTENPELEQQIKVYVEKWRKIAETTRQCDRNSVAKAVKYIYKAIGKKEPEIIFLDSPYQSEIKFTQFCKNIMCVGIPPDYLKQSSPFSKQLGVRRVNGEMTLIAHVSNILSSPQVWQSWPDGWVMNLRFGVILPYFWAEWASWFDFCRSVFGSKPQKEWAAYQSLAKYAGWMFPYGKFCVLCDRPRVLRLDNENRVHAEGEPAIQFADGFSAYAYHGVSLPEKYGKLHPSQWRPEWLLSERNAELRRVLIQGIGYDRMCQELQATLLDAWQEYQLLRIDSPVETEAMHLLKMTCPSTGYVHAMRVPPDLESAREAIKWINWEIDPSEFSVQT